MTFAEFADNIYLPYCEEHNQNYYVKGLFVATLKKYFGRKRLADIIAADCRDFQHIRANTPTKNGTRRSAASVNKETSTLSRMFTLACERDLLKDSPMRWVKKLKEAPARTRILSDEEKERLWHALQEDTLLARMVALGLHTSLRKGQLVALTPDAVDLRSGRLSIIASKGRPPRVVPLNSTAANTLHLMIEEGQLPLPLRDFRKRWAKALKNAEIVGFRWHDLRRCFGTDLIKAGVNPYYVKELFAHSSMEISSIYMKADMEHLTEAVRRLDPPESEAVN